MFKKLSQLFGSVGLIFAVAMLGAIGGQGPKEVRRFILPSIVTIYAYFMLQNWWVLTIYLMAFPLSIGYGIQDYNYWITGGDKGSTLGRFWFRLFNDENSYKTFWPNVMTRGTVGLLISLSMISVPLITGKWFSYFAGSQNIIGVWALLSWRDFGEVEVKLFGKTVKLLKVDLTCYAVTTLGILTIVTGIFG